MQDMQSALYATELAQKRNCRQARGAGNKKF